MGGTRFVTDNLLPVNLNAFTFLDVVCTWLPVCSYLFLSLQPQIVHSILSSFTFSVWCRCSSDESVSKT